MYFKYNSSGKNSLIMFSSLSLILSFSLPLSLISQTSSMSAIFNALSVSLSVSLAGANSLNNCPYFRTPVADDDSIDEDPMGNGRAKTPLFDELSIPFIDASLPPTPKELTITIFWRIFRKVFLQIFFFVYISNNFDSLTLFSLLIYNIFLHC